MISKLGEKIRSRYHIDQEDSDTTQGCSILYPTLLTLLHSIFYSMHYLNICASIHGLLFILKYPLPGNFNPMASTNHYYSGGSQISVFSPHLIGHVFLVEVLKAF